MLIPDGNVGTYKDRNTGERITQTEWHNIVIWRGMAETAEKYLRKGSQVYIEGKIKPDLGRTSKAKNATPPKSWPT